MGNKPTGYTHRKERYSAPSKEDKKNQPKRTEIFREIVSSERTYVNALTELHDNWYLPLMEAIKYRKPIIPQKEINNIFTISEGILCLHQNLLKALESALTDWDENQTIGDIFIRNANALKLYTEYINRYNISVETLNVVITQPLFQEFTRSRTRGNPAHVLTSLLIQPVQRIPRYEMLLKDLLKCTWISHPDYENLEIAVEKIVEAAAFNNEQKRKAECLMRLLEIQNELKEVIQIHQSGRDIIKEGQIKIPKQSMLSQKKGKKRKTVHYCLTNDNLLIWDNDTVLFYEELAAIIFKEQTEIKYVIVASKSTGQEITIYFKKTEDKEEWLDLFKKTRKEKQTQDNQIHKAVFILPKNSISEKEPLIPKSDKETSTCCCF